MDTLKKLREIIEKRRGADTKKSYVAKMFARGRPKIAQKVGEEASEVVIASLVENDDDLINESADLLFHLSMLWADRNIDIDDVMKELEDRMQKSKK